MQTNQKKRNLPSMAEVSAPQLKLLGIQREFQAPVMRLFQAFSTAAALKPGGGRTAHTQTELTTITAKAAGMSST